MTIDYLQIINSLLGELKRIQGVLPALWLEDGEDARKRLVKIGLHDRDAIIACLIELRKLQPEGWNKQIWE